MALASSSRAGSLGFLVVDAAGVPLHRARTVVLAPPTRRGPYKAAGRLVLVAAMPAAPAPGPEGGDGHRLPSGEVALKFGEEMKAFQNSYRPLTLLPGKPEMAVDVAYATAIDCRPILEFLLSKETVHPDTYEGLVLAGKAFLTIEQQAGQGYLRAEALVNGIEGMKLMGKAFFGSELLPESKTPELPCSDDYIMKQAFFRDLVTLFAQHRSAVHAEAINKYLYVARGAYDDPPSADRKLEAAFRFWSEMEAFQSSYRPLTVLSCKSEMTVEVPLGVSQLINTTLWTATDSVRLFECLLANKAVNSEDYKAMVQGGEMLLILAGQCEEGYVGADALVDAINSLEVAGGVFFPGVSSPKRMLQYNTVPLPSGDFNKMDYMHKVDYMNDLVQTFILYYTCAGWVARDLYGFDLRGRA